MDLFSPEQFGELSPQAGFELPSLIHSDGGRMPKREIQLATKVLAAVSAVLSLMGKALGQ